MAGTTVKPAAASQTKPGHQGRVTPLDVMPPRKVTYVFQATTSNELIIPYAVAVDGIIQPAFAQRAKGVPGKSGRIVVTVLQGQRVSLYLNSDAAAAWRQHPVYAVTAGERDIVVTIREKVGKHTDADTPVRQVATDPKVEAAKGCDTYAAPLTGDIWMKVSHKYTAAEVDARLPAGTSAAVAAAVKSIYTGLSHNTLTVTESAAGGRSTRHLSVRFEDAGNPRNNISSYALLADGLPRAHPAGYAALMTAALEHSITAITLSSCWRPMLGTIAHRAGLGLDVSVLGRTVLNRKELRNAFDGENASKQGNGNDNDNVTDAEVMAFGAYEKAIAEHTAAKRALEAAKAAHGAAQRNGDVESTIAARERFIQAVAAIDRTEANEEDARLIWDAERDRGEPADAKLFRTSLLKCSCVRQLLDPWFIELNTRDAHQPKANMQRGKNNSLERLHAHHLHITVDDPRIV